MTRAARIGLVAGVVGASAGCWAAPGAGPDRQAHNPFETVITTDTVATLDEAWSVDIGGGVTDPVVSTSGVHITGGSGSFAPDIFAFTTNGQPLWSRWSGLDEFTQKGSTITDGDRVAVSLYGHEGEETVTQWYAAADGTPLGEPEPRLVLDGLRGSQAVFSWRPNPGLFEGGLFVGDVDDPGARWGGLISSQNLLQPLTIGRQFVYHAGFGLTSADPGASVQQGVRAFPVAGGSTDCELDFACPVWATTNLDGAATAPVIGEGETTVYVGTIGGTVYALDATTGAIQWSADVGAAVTHPPALADGSLFVPTADGDLVVLAAAGCGVASCTALWTASTGSEITEQPAVAGGVVFTASADGALHGFSAAGCGGASCGPLWSTSTGSRITGAPAVTRGRLFVGTQDGRLIAYAPAG